MRRLVFIAGYLFFVVMAAIKFDLVWERGQTDFPIYWQGAHGQFLISAEGKPGWLHNEKFAYIFKPLTLFERYRDAFVFWYSAGILATGAVLWRLYCASSRCFFGSVLAAAVFGYGVYVCWVNSGNVSIFLALLCTTGWGALLAGFYKPYLFVFALLHALAAVKVRGSRPAVVEAGKYDLHCPGLDSALQDHGGSR